MIKIIHSPVKDGEEKKVAKRVKYSLFEDENGIELSFSIGPKFDMKYKARMNYGDYAGKIVEIALVTTDKINDLKIYQVYNTVLPNSFLQNRAVSDMHIARVVFDEECNDVVILLCKDTDDIDGFMNIVFDRSKQSAAGALAQHSSYFADNIKRRKIKAEMINEVDIYATVSYLEAQVDVLTRIVLSSAPEGKLKDILSWADCYSVLDIKTQDGIIEELKEDKGKIRELQRRYYNAKRIL